MNSPAAAQTAAATPRPGAPRRSAAISPLRRLSRIVLVTGTALALLAALGPLWLARVGVVVAVAAALAACLGAWLELAEARRAHADDMLRASRAAGAVLSEERRHNAAVVDTLTRRVVRSMGEAAELRGQVAELGATVETMQGTVVGLRRQIDVLTRQQHADAEQLRQRAESLSSLQQTLLAREAELRELLASQEHVRTLPRRLLARHGDALSQPSDSPRRSSGGHQPTAEHAQVEPGAGSGADGRWPDDRRPEVSELVQVAVVLPNYEGERRLA